MECGCVEGCVVIFGKMGLIGEGGGKSECCRGWDEVGLSVRMDGRTDARTGGRQNPHPPTHRHIYKFILISIETCLVEGLGPLQAREERLRQRPRVVEVGQQVLCV